MLIPRSYRRLRTICRLVLVVAVTPLSSDGAEVERGHLVVVKEPISGESKVRRLRSWQRAEGAPTATAVNEDGRKVTIDSMAVLWRINLADLEMPNLLNSDDMDQATRMAAGAAVGLERYPALASYLGPTLTRLRSEIARAQGGERKLKGKWFTAAQWVEFQERNRSTISRGTLVLKNGTKYRDVDITSATPQELRIMHSDGAAVIPMSEVPVEFQREYLKNLLPPAK